MKNKYGITEKSFSIILNTLKEHEEIERAVIFGSRAMGNYKKGSDIDIAIYGANILPESSMNLSGKLNEASPIPYCIDVVSPQFVKDKDIIQHIEKFGKVFYLKEILPCNSNSKLLKPD